MPAPAAGDRAAGEDVRLRLSTRAEETPLTPGIGGLAEHEQLERSNEMGVLGNRFDPRRLNGVGGFRQRRWYAQLMRCHEAEVAALAG